MAIVVSRRRLLLLLSFSVFVLFLYHLSSSRAEPGPVRQLRKPLAPHRNVTILEDGLRVQFDDLQDASSQPDEHSSALGVFSQVFVVSRPTRLDRRATMEQLRAALSIQWTYVDAISFEDPLVDQISECVRSSRRNNRARSFNWPPRADVDQIVRSPLLPPYGESAHWLSTNAGTPCRYPVPPFKVSVPASGSGEPSLRRSVDVSADLRPRATAPLLPLTCAVQDRTHGLKYKPSLLSYLLLTPAKFACWYSHLDAIQRVAAYNESLVGPDGTGAPHGAALILEDDVDMERDVRGRLREVWNVLPDDWDIVFLGHCWSNEARYPALRYRGTKSSGLYPKMSVHPSFAPKCTHAYAVSPAGARRILLHLLYPPFAYSRALDQAFAWLVQTGRLRAFSVVPSLVVQHKLTGSDIDGGENGLGSGWKDQLEHGFFHV